MEFKIAANEQRRAEEAENKDPLEITRAGKRRLTLQGTIALAIRRNFGNCAQEDVGSMLLEDISRFTVSRAESRAGSALIASSRLFFHAMFHELTTPVDGSGRDFRVVFHAYKQDATNSGILKGSKLVALILRSAYLRERVPDQDCQEPLCGFKFDDYFDSIERVGDILPVVHGDSEATAAQTLKHLEGW